MKKLTYLIVTLIGILVFSSCDPGHNVEYIIDNQSSENITILSNSGFFRSRSDSSRISTDTELTILVDLGIGSRTEDYINELNTIPIDSLIIKNAAGQLFKKDPFLIDNWEREYIKENDIGFVKLTVTDNDF